MSGMRRVRQEGASAPFFDRRPAHRLSPGWPGKGGRCRQRGAAHRPAVAGGGPLGATWEIGALCALEEALPALDFTRLDGYVGVSAGAFVAAALPTA